MKTIHSLWARRKHEKYPDDADDSALVLFAKEEFYAGMRSFMEEAVDKHEKDSEGDKDIVLAFYMRSVKDMIIHDRTKITDKKNG